MITMIQASDIYSFVEGQLTDTPYFLVAVDQPEADSFAVAIDSAAPADIDFCAELSREIRDHFGADLDDYNLEVGSAGITAFVHMLSLMATGTPASAPVSSPLSIFS